MKEIKTKKDRPICAICKKLIVKGRVHYQEGNGSHPIHKNCISVVKRNRYGEIE